MPFSLPELPYATNALEPVVDAQTMEVHHGKHHQTYVTKLNEAIATVPELDEKSLEELLTGWSALPATVQTAVRNHGGGHYNHSLFWAIMQAPGNHEGDISSELQAAIDRDLGGLEKFKTDFGAAATGVFGSGWAWIIVDHGVLKIETTPNQDCPLMNGRTPILGLDVWEHAYYLKHQNRRADYIKDWWQVVNWAEVSRRFAAAST